MSFPSSKQLILPMPKDAVVTTRNAAERDLAAPVPGNNAVEMQTTATFDRRSDEFVIDTPTTLAQKYWCDGAVLLVGRRLSFCHAMPANDHSS